MCVFGVELLHQCGCLTKRVSLIAVIVVFVVTAQGCEAPQADAVREKYLGTCIHPYLQRKRGDEK